MIDRNVVEQIVTEILQKLVSQGNQVQKPGGKPGILAFDLADDAESPQLEQLEAFWKVIRMPLTAKQVPAEIEAAVFLNATQDLLVKGALGICDTLESKWLARLLRKGIPTYFIPSAELEWLAEREPETAASTAYKNHLLGCKQRLESFGVCFRSSLADLVPGAEASRVERPGEDGDKGSFIFEGRLLTQRDVEAVKGGTILILPSTIVTPLARDTAREMGKTIRLMEPGGKKRGP